MATVKLSIQDKNELDKFTKFLALKSAQIIVQSRLGQKVHTKCKPQSSGTDWFNLAIRDLPEVVTEAKRAMHGEVVTAHLPLCVEISLRTVEGDSMNLETWCLGVLPEQCDPSVRVTYTVYNRMGILLKSLVSVTRVTPGYKLSRQQGPDSYVICYRIYMGEPQLHNLGEGYNQVRVGQLSTPVGTLHLTVSYRTNVILSPQKINRDNCILLKSDHFHTDITSKNTADDSLTDTIKLGAFVDTSRVAAPNEEGDFEIPDAPFSSLLRTQSPLQDTINSNSPPEDNRTPSPKSANLRQPPSPLTNSPPARNSNLRFREEIDDGNGNITPHLQSATNSRRSSCSANEDFIMVDLKIPFVSDTNSNNDLSTFFKECQRAPPLKTFQDQQTLTNEVEDISKTLEDLELSMKEYENMLSSFCVNENNN